MIGDNPREWRETTPLGPCYSDAECRQAIREDIAYALNGCESLSTGRDESWSEKYTIVEEVKVIKPCLDVTAKITLKNLKP